MCICEETKKNWLHTQARETWKRRKIKTIKLILFLVDSKAKKMNGKRLKRVCSEPCVSVSLYFLLWLLQQINGKRIQFCYIISYPFWYLLIEKKPNPWKNFLPQKSTAIWLTGWRVVHDAFIKVTFVSKRTEIGIILHLYIYTVQDKWNELKAKRKKKQCKNEKTPTMAAAKRLTTRKKDQTKQIYQNIQYIHRNQRESGEEIINHKRN